MTKELQGLLDQYPVFEYDERQKLRCTLTGHEIPSNFDQLDQYVKTSKFVRAWKMHQIMKEYGEYFDDIGPHEFGCKITMKIISKDPDDLLRHINGKKFKKGLEKAPVIEENELSDGILDEEEMEEDEMDMHMHTEVINDDSFSEDEGGLDKDDEYPELIKTGGESVVESESYDFTVMDTEKDMNGASRKRKADSSTTLKKKRVR
uniref:Surfeit locus protein 2 n=1 Tax=Loa loa TaxID=7209 RepID=A0A1I7VQC5_LOALO